MAHKDPVRRREYHTQYMRKRRELHRALGIIVRRPPPRGDALNVARAAKRRYIAIRAGWIPDEYAKAERIRPTVTACDCCGSRDPRHPFGWQADHDHGTGRYRGFLCVACNMQIGHTEKWGMAMSAPVAVYLARHSG